MPNLALYVEIDLPYCDFDFGKLPCTATGAPCFNSRNHSHDCGDTAAYSEGKKTVRFCLNNGINDTPDDDVPTYPLLESVASTSATVDPAKSIGTRAKFSMTLNNAKSLLVGLDKNIIARSEDANRGTFLGKFKARFPYIFGSEVRVYRGAVGDITSVEHYIIDSMSGPNSNGKMTFQCVDFLRLLNGDSSQYPKPTDGKITAAMDADQTAFSVYAGEGSQYATSGIIAIGKEGMRFTRSGDNFTVERGEFGDIEPHKIDDTVWQGGEFSSSSSSEIISELLSFTPLDSSVFDSAAALIEDETFQNARYSATIPKPTSVKLLIDELVEQAGLIVYADVLTNKIAYKIMRPALVEQSFIDQNMSGFTQSELQGERVSQAYIYFNQKNPLLKLSEESNYDSIALKLSPENLYKTEVVKKIFSRWVPAFAQTLAVDIGDRIIERYVNPPKQFGFKVIRDHNVSLGQGLSVTNMSNEDAFGDALESTAFITSLKYGELENDIKAKQFTFTQQSDSGGVVDNHRVFPITRDAENINLYELYFSAYSSLEGVDSISFIVRSGAYVGGKYRGETSLIVGGDFGLIPVSLIIEPGGVIAGTSNSDAINADYPIRITNNGTIGGGGGDGGQGLVAFEYNNETIAYKVVASGAGSRQQRSIECINENLGVNTYVISDKEAGLTALDVIAQYKSKYDIDLLSAYNTFGASGGLGEAGNDASIIDGDETRGKPAGKAVTNNSNITWVSQGDIRGVVE